MASSPPHPPVPSTTTPPPSHTSYRIGRGEQGVLTHEPYKSHLLPLWRFRTAALAHTSSRALWAEFLAYDAADDFVGMDMTRKFVQMGMTRAKRYANHRGGRKYEAGTGRELEREGAEWEGRSEKVEASRVFEEVWGWCRAHGGYREKKRRFLREVRRWEREGKVRGKGKGRGGLGGLEVKQGEGTEVKREEDAEVKAEAG